MLLSKRWKQRVGKKLVTLTSELSNSSRSAAIACVMKVIEFIRKKYQHLPLSISVYVWGDDCASQFRSRIVFSLLSTIDSSVDQSWFYNEWHHGKMDSIGSALKNLVFRDIKSGKCNTETPKNFADMLINP